MTKEEYTEFLSLQEHFEWLHAAEDRAKTKLETFTTDDSEFDELVREAIKVYFETEIDKAWKKIEEFKTGIAYKAEKVSPAYNELLTFAFDGIKVKIRREDVWRAEQTCIGSRCLSSYCPFFEKPNIEVGAGCRRIFDMYFDGQYMVSNGIFEEDE